MTVVILSAVAPTLVATTLFRPAIAGEAELEEFDAAEEIDAGLLPRPGPAGAAVALGAAGAHRQAEQDEHRVAGRAEPA